MNVSDVYGSRYLAAKDVTGRKIKARIEGAAVELVKGNDRESRNRVVLQLAGVKKLVVLNATNATVLVKSFGEELDGWLGQEVVIFTRMVNFAGKLVDGLAVEPVPPPRQAVTK